MKIFRHFRDVPDTYRGAVVAVGTFDGVHLGHQALIGRARDLAAERGGLLGVVAFEPHPQEFFRPSPESFRLTPLRTKARLIAGQGADAMFALTFDAEMAAMRAQDFVLDVLLRALGVSHVVVGDDFRFGQGRAGDVTLLAYMGEMEGFGVTVFEPVSVAGQGKISSTRIREALKQGRPDAAARLLGHWWSIESRVERGDGRGRTIGFPTANMRLVDCMKPAYGVYAVRATVMEGENAGTCHAGVANFGVRPMFKSDEPLLETYVFDFDSDIYGKHLAVELIAWLRPEAKLDGLEALKKQIGEDCDAARVILARTAATPGALG